MRHFSVGRSPVGLLLSSILIASAMFGATEPGPPAKDSAEPISPSASVRAAGVEPKLEFVYAGSYLVDGKFEPPAKLRDSQPQANRLAQETNGHPLEVPAWVNLHSREETVENLLPRYRAKKTARGQSFWTAFRDDLITFAYGHERLLAAPQRVITDSAGRVIVVDPAGSAVHVLSQERSFRIVTGPDRRVEKPAGVAVDGDDNIYVSDCARGVIAVYDSSGKFLRYIGRPGDEPLFYYATGLAIDRRTERLYVLDTERHLMFVMDLLGNEISRVGRYQGNDKVVDFLHPTEVVVGADILAILDSDGHRVWITDLEGNPLNTFLLADRKVSPMSDHVGLAIDAFANVYVTQQDEASVRIYNRNGRLLNMFGGTGEAAVNLAFPTGVWIDRGNRMFVADETRRRIEVFQMRANDPAHVAGVH